jgi:hypothetical protein
MKTDEKLKTLQFRGIKKRNKVFLQDFLVFSRKRKPEKEQKEKGINLKIHL